MVDALDCADASVKRASSCWVSSTRAFDALAGVSEIECVEVSSGFRWRGVWLIASGVPRRPTKPSRYPVPRGTIVVRSGNSALVWVAGNAPDVSTKGDFYQGGKSIPRPLQLIRHAGRGPLEVTAHEALALTKNGLE